MFCSVHSFGLDGIDPYLVRVELDSRRGLPGFDIVGLPDAAVKESRERVKSAVQNLGYPFPNAKVVANLAPAHTRKAGSVYDLALLLALIHASGYEELALEGTAVLGEIGLDGSLRGIHGVLPMVLQAHALGLRRVILPAENASEAAVAQGVELLTATHADQVVAFLSGRGEPLPAAASVCPPPPAAPPLPDLADVRGQETAKRAMEVAAAGLHNLLFVGSPGAGKSMLARRLPSILPAMTRQEAEEATMVHSVAGMLPPGVGLLHQRPFRSPHHSASSASLAGGGSSPRPGDISLAHNGVLFLDELPEFAKASLEVLRQPLEEGRVHISRVRQRITYPSRFMLVAAMNPCRCGYHGHPTRVCSCAPAATRAYLSKVSGPLLDRIDIQVDVPPVEYGEISSSRPVETSAQVRGRVEAARRRQLERYAGEAFSCNAGIPPDRVEAFCLLEPAALTLLQAAFEKLGLTARGYHRILRVARTVADLEGAERITERQLAQAIQFRTLDRKYWNG